MANSASFEAETELSMLLWFKIDGATAGTAEMHLGGLNDDQSGSGRYGFSVQGYTSNRVRGFLRISNPPTGAQTTQAIDTLTVANGGVNYRNNQWHFAVLTMKDDGSNKLFSLYMDGSSTPTASASISSGAGKGLTAQHTSALATGILEFGNDLGDTTRALKGSLDEIAFIDRALTGQNVADLWQAALVPEPGSITLFGIGGLIGLAVVRKRRAMKK
jgi:hypothetical protein